MCRGVGVGAIKSPHGNHGQPLPTPTNIDTSRGLNESGKVNSKQLLPSVRSGRHSLELLPVPTCSATVATWQARRTVLVTWTRQIHSAPHEARATRSKLYCTVQGPLVMMVTPCTHQPSRTESPHTLSRKTLRTKQTKLVFMNLF